MFVHKSVNVCFGLLWVIFLEVILYHMFHYFG